MNTETMTSGAGRRAWPAVLLMAGLVLAARIAYLIWICPYELAADEAHYWEWSRRLDLSYYSKGPGVAWLIHASTALFGIAEWTIRLPAALSSFACALLVAALAVSAAPNRPSIGVYAASLFMLAPVFHGTAQFMTIDGPYYACWLLAALIAWRLSRTPATLGGYFLLGAIIGVGMLFKYTVLLLVPGVIWFLFRAHPAAPARRLIRSLAFLAGALLLSSPIFVWNALHGWPTVAHLLGHAGLPGGDIPADTGWRYNPFWSIGYLLYPFVVLGPPMGILLIIAIRKAWRSRLQDPDRWTLLVFSLAASLPILTFYLLLSLKTDIELNWAVAGYTTLIAPIAWMLSDSSRAAPAVRRLWKGTVTFGVAVAILISFGKWPLDWISRVEIAGWHIPSDRALKRVSGHKDLARQVEKVARAARQSTSQEPFIVAQNYGTASLLAFYITNHPSVHAASSMMGGRESAYDYFDDTSLSDPDLLGRPAILVGATCDAWDQTLYFDSIIRTRTPRRLFLASGYGGPIRESRLPLQPGRR